MRVMTFIKDRLWQRLNHWTTTKLSLVGKEVILRQLLRHFLIILSVFLLPKYLCGEHETKFNLFGGDARKRVANPFIGFVGIIYVNRRKWGSWFLKII